jgi:hypothetical protein
MRYPETEYTSQTSGTLKTSRANPSVDTYRTYGILGLATFRLRECSVVQSKLRPVVIPLAMETRSGKQRLFAGLQMYFERQLGSVTVTVLQLFVCELCVV